jgi:poly-gamma-glutamate synthesis protein (capsule biosynthesis protein)
VAPGGRLVARVEGLAAPVRLQLRSGDRWRNVGVPVARTGARLRARAPMRERVLRVRARGADGALSTVRRVRVRALTLAAVGDVNLGDGPGAMMARFGFQYPWTSVGPTLRRADIAFANLESAVSRRGRPESKKYVFRGHPNALKAMRRHAGMDVVNLANNHAGDYGKLALLDTIKHARASQMAPVGAGASAAAAYRATVVERLGLRVAFVGFSTILPFEFRAIGSRPGTAWGFPAQVRRAVRRAHRQADVVVATFHWGAERATTEGADQRQLAAIALRAGATAVIGAHPHVLQPIRRPPRRLVAYSLGNFVFSANSPGTQNTGILRIRLARGRVLGAKLLRARIVASRPVLR